jgi:digeranylgeranylglycerophospholipid reductase
MRQYDVAVVGASFAGLALARSAAGAGLSVVVLDRKPEPGASVQTTGILVPEAEREWPVPSALCRPIGRIRLYAPSLHSIDLDRPGYRFFSTDTQELLRWFAREAAHNGAELRWGALFRGASESPHEIPLASHDVRARFLVGADGPQSTVARAFGLGTNRQFLMGVEAELEGVAELPEALHCFLDSRLAPGYLAWVVPGVGLTQVGLATRLPARPRLNLFLDRVRSLFDLSRARIVGGRAGLIPVGGPVNPPARGRVLLAGDAAGLVSPLTAGGIHTALASGRGLGLALCRHLLQGAQSPADSLARSYPRVRTKRLLRAVLHQAPPNWILDYGVRTPPLRALARLVYFHHRGLLDRAAWRDLLARRGSHSSPTVE